MSYKTYEVRVYDNGDKHWCYEDQCHREDGPAIEYADGTKYWYYKDLLHRANGPAIEYADGSKRWFYEGREYTEEEWKKLVNPDTDTCAGKVVEIEGKKYKLQAL